MSMVLTRNVIDADILQYLSDPLSAIKRRASKSGTKISVSGTNVASEGVTAASAASTAIVFLNANSGEGYITVEGVPGDRLNLDPLHNANDLVEAVASLGKPIILVVHSVGPILLERVLALKNVHAIVWAGLPGQESGNALADILFGDVNPSGKLPYTIAQKEEDYGMSVQRYQRDEFKERIYIDYRNFDSKNIAPRYEFGFGLCKYIATRLREGLEH
jgi:beta-glucosidase